MNKIIFILFIGGILLCMSACRKYVEIAPEQTKILRTTADYQQLLYNSNTMDLGYYYPIFAGDDLESTEVRWQTGLSTAAANSYSWAAKNFGDLEEDPDWSNPYKQIYLCNTIIFGVMNSEEGTLQQKQLALASAQVHRAFNYFMLVNLYGKQYDAATASTDPGVPLVLEPKFLTDLTRASVQKVYDLVKSDLNSALPFLPDLPDFNSNPSKAAVYSLLARIYLNTREFSEAERYAKLALTLKGTLIDLNEYKASQANYPRRIANPEEIFFKRLSQVPVAYPISNKTLNLFDQINDLRYSLFTIAGSAAPGAQLTVGRAYYKHRLANDGVYIGPSVPEMMLIVAECEARANNNDAALTVLNNFRRKRYDSSTPYVNLSAANSNEALKLVIEEREREFMARGFRWFDQRRLTKDAGMIPTVSRLFKDITYTIEPGSNRYTFAIADKYINLNPEIIQNPR